MHRLKRYSALVATRAVEAGFTMIELLVVIAILGILAVAVLSAINPIEQINRGRDTGSRSDAEQLLSAVDRYNAFNGYYPWVSSEAAGVGTIIVGTPATPQRIDHSWAPYDDAGNLLTPGTATSLTGTQCSILARLAEGSESPDPDCVGTSELKLSFTNRVTNTSYRGLFMYKSTDGTDSSPYICFAPQSQAFKNEATDRCSEPNLPQDFPDGACENESGTNNEYWASFNNAAGTPINSDGDWICLP